VKIAQAKLEDSGYKVTFSKNCKETDIFKSPSIKSRVNDIHEAFRDKNVKAMLTVIGGFNSNQLLKYLDYDLIKKNPKILCGYSDITALANAITKKTGLITYSGPHFSTFGMKKGFDHTLEYFNKCLTKNEPFEIMPSKEWSDDAWYKDQENRKFVKNEGYKLINEGKAEGKIVGGNLCTFNLLQGTEFMPDLKDTILFLEDDDLAGDYFSVEFERNLQSIIHQKGFEKVRGIVIGRFQTKTDINFEKLKQIIKTKKELDNIPVISYFDFGHTYPLITFPIGGTAKLIANNKEVSLTIIAH
jgi:muramoyltetrapeptide carboxypeptidase LdcA involved in peptidoglycan recycling